MILHERAPVLAAVLTAVVSSAVAAALFLATGMFYVLPVGLLVAIIGNAPVAYLVMYVGLPLAGVVFLRPPWPWWARWVCLGVMATNIVLAFVADIFS